jgi:predicted RNase H-like nuclease (RuvC/YqgF family)
MNITVMETLYVWLLTFAGATMVGCFLSSERELGKQRREINWLRRNHRPSEPQGSETHGSAELMTRNKELVETISFLSAQLEESKRTVEELQCEQRQLVSAGELNQQLQASQKTIKELEAEQQRLGSKGDIQMKQPVCPKCSSNYVKRVSRIGSERLISLFYIYPFRCQPCGHRFRLFKWGVRYTRTVSF